ncbi:hypothetical protein PG985_007893 [Apiospora marii]|uniref:uncharacterized protein n=1 Tax=Apiospora marii TaxID=335849 RepID=UPI00312FF570
MGHDSQKDYDLALSSLIIRLRVQVGRSSADHVVMQCVGDKVRFKPSLGFAEETRQAFDPTGRSMSPLKSTSQGEPPFLQQRCWHLVSKLTILQREMEQTEALIIFSNQPPSECFDGIPEPQVAAPFHKHDSAIPRAKKDDALFALSFSPPL